MTDTINLGLNDPDGLARDFVARVIPGILQGEHSESLSPEAILRLEGLNETKMAFLSDAPDQHADLLIEAAKPFAPPPSLEGGTEVRAVLTGIIALRAAMPDFMDLPAPTRYLHAADWVCENFGKLIWWNCD